jgi:signal transduction histidine kinase
MSSSPSFSTHPPTEPSRIGTLLTNPRGQALVALLAFLGIILFNSFYYLYSPYMGLEVDPEDPFGEVYFVYPGGPAEEAGVQAGDLVLAIDGRLLNADRSEPRFRPWLGPGDIVRVQLQRGATVLTVEISLGSKLDNLSALAANLGIQILSVGLWLTGLLLILFVPLEDARARLLGLGFLLAGLTAAVGGASGWNSFWGANTLQLILLTVLSPILIAAHLTFPTISGVHYRRPLINLSWALAILFSGLLMLERWFLPVAVTDQVGFNLRRSVLVYFMLAWLLGVGLLVWNRFKSGEPEIRRQTGIVIWGMVLGIGPFFSLTLLPYLLLGEEYFAGYYSILFLLLLPLAYLYVIFQRRLLQLDFLINRLVVFFVQLLLVLVVSILILGVAALLLDLPAGLPLLGGFVITLVALSSGGLQRRIQEQVNRILYGAHYDFSTVTASLSSQLAETLDRARLIDLLTIRLARQMGIKQTALLLVDDGQLQLQRPPDDLFTVDIADEVFQKLRGGQAPVRAAQLWERLSPAAGARWGRFAWGQLFGPLVFEGQMHGMLVLGPRFSGDVYSEQDIQIVATVAHQGALALANIHLVEELRGLAQQLVRADEDQRKRMARELHDTVLQDLFFIKQGLFRDQKKLEISEQLDSTIQKLRGVIKAQRPALLDQGLMLALQGLTEDMQKIAGSVPQISWYCELSEPLLLPEEQTTSVFRIAQEALTNAVKHALANEVVIKLERAEEDVHRLVIADDGVGLAAVDPGGESESQQYGIAGMRERARMIGGQLEIRSQQERG